MTRPNPSNTSQVAEVLSAYRESARARPESAQWKPRFAAGLGSACSLDNTLYDFGANVGRFCTSEPKGWANLEYDCDNFVETLRSAIKGAKAKAEYLSEYLNGLPAELRVNPRLMVMCDITVHDNLRCQVFPYFGGRLSPPGFTDAGPYETPGSYFLHLKGVGRLRCKPDAELQPVISDMAALIVLAFEECLDVFRKRFTVEVESAPVLRLEWGGPDRSRRVNLGFVTEKPKDTAAREAEMARLDEIEKSDGLLASFACTFPEGSPEQFVLFVEAAPPKSPRISVVRDLTRVGYFSKPLDFLVDSVRTANGGPGRFIFNNRNLMSVVGNLTKSLDRVRPDWRSAHVPDLPKRARRLNARAR